MASSEDYKKLYELYQVEGVPKGISIVDFCQRNGIVYKHFERWFKKRYSQNHPDQPGPIHPAEQPNLPPATVSGREVGGAMLGIKGTTRLWYVSSITNMRLGKYRLFSEVEALGRNPYNGDGYLSMSKDRRTVRNNYI